MNIPNTGQVPQTVFKRTRAIILPKVKRVLEVLDLHSAEKLTDQVLIEEGKNEQTINEATKKAEDKKIVNELIKKSNRCIIKTSSPFPWTLLPNSIEVEESKVVCIFRQFLSSQTYSVDIKDISNVFIETSPFFATLRIVSRTFTQNEMTIGHLITKKALQVKLVIEGLRTLAEHDVDTSNYEVHELRAKIDEFHTDAKI